MSSKLDDPEWRRERATKASRAAHDPETPARKLVRDWPKLTAEQKTRIRAIIRPIAVDEPDSGAVA